ncbi:AzlC family ABC transporter permease [Clostridium botulinum]|nr:AzlC family ABC transporter permease [Clostridium botulinum]NFI19229.1 AzlC family ABC transporter permease [Clostridium botulinum]NFI53011.1 AzlC family ABC transporter permease [Clostridium botulinum]NFL93124.1 AzlC family ABC transporter permease [Clostridium botulinum]NFN51343.1 AzlC family ABC transporter permease [Clostridium botulinum]
MKKNIKLKTINTKKIYNLDNYKYGLKKGIPISLGYLSVSITFGMMATQGGLNPWIALLISMTNLTSAGQFAGINLIFISATYLEIALTIFVINIRYMLMSLSLSQKMQDKIPLFKRLIISFGITDETFTLASLEIDELTSEFMLGLMTLPYLGWALGTFIGAITTRFLPLSLQDSLGIALYAMFIALIIPQVKKSKPILVVVIIAVIISCIFRYITCLNKISSGFVVIVASIISSAIGAYLFPIKEDL